MNYNSNHAMKKTNALWFMLSVQTAPIVLKSIHFIPIHNLWAIFDIKALFITDFFGYVLKVNNHCLKYRGVTTLRKHNNNIFNKHYFFFAEMFSTINGARLLYGRRQGFNRVWAGLKPYILISKATAAEVLHNLLLSLYAFRTMFSV